MLTDAEREQIIAKYIHQPESYLPLYTDLQDEYPSMTQKDYDGLWIHHIEGCKSCGVVFRLSELDSESICDSCSHEYYFLKDLE